MIQLQHEYWPESVNVQFDFIYPASNKWLLLDFNVDL